MIKVCLAGRVNNNQFFSNPQSGKVVKWYKEMITVPTGSLITALEAPLTHSFDIFPLILFRPLSLSPFRVTLHRFYWTILISDP